MSVQTFLTPTTVNTRPDAKLVTTAGLDLILPCCNPPKDWASLLITHYSQVAALMEPVPLQLILVNDGSTRNVGPAQLELLRAAIPGIIIVSYPVNRGKGHAIREGVKRSVYSHQVCTDLDFPFGVAAVKEAYMRLLQGADVVAGERGAGYLQLLPPRRRFITRISRAMNRYLLQLKVSDAQAGFKAFNQRGRKVLLDTRIDGFLYDSEFIYKAGKEPGVNIAPVAINCRPGISFSAFRTGLLLRELRNYLRIFIR